MRRCLHDATDYSSEGQEHFGKLIKQAVRLLNQKLYKDTDKTKSGKAKVSYVQQAVNRLVWVGSPSPHAQRSATVTSTRRAGSRG
jgi:hypothetical protein